MALVYAALLIVRDGRAVICSNPFRYDHFTGHLTITPENTDVTQTLWVALTNNAHSAPRPRFRYPHWCGKP